MLLVFDDLQSADDDSVDLLLHLVERLSGSILLVCLARPEFLGVTSAGRLPPRRGTTSSSLRRSSGAHASQIMQALLAPCEGGPPDRLVEAGVGMASGNPGLLEHMVRIFHDTGVLKDVGDNAMRPVWRVDLDRLAQAKLPLTVEDAVAARLAGARTAERRLLEHATSMGSVFWLGGLVALARMDRDAPEYWTTGAGQRPRRDRALLGELVQRDYVLRLPDSAFPARSSSFSSTTSSASGLPS
jgi:predicted ATPase